MTQNLVSILHYSGIVVKLERRLMTITSSKVPAIELTLLTFILIG